MSRSKQNPSWSAAELIALKHMRDVRALEWNHISGHLPGRSRAACQFAYYTHILGQRKRRVDGRTPTAQLRAPDPVFEARERRMLASARRDLTGLIFGDPPPGYSALDEKRSARP